MYGDVLEGFSYTEIISNIVFEFLPVVDLVVSLGVDPSGKPVCCYIKEAFTGFLDPFLWGMRLVLSLAAEWSSQFMTFSLFLP